MSQPENSIPFSLIAAWALTTLLVMGDPSMALAQQVKEPPSTASEDAPPFDLEVQMKSFDQVWKTVKQVHWDPEVSGERWDQARETYRPRVAAATSQQEVQEILEEMLATLQQSHFGIIPTRAYEAVEEQSNSGGPGYSGLTCRLIEDKIVVARVDPESPAAMAGIRSGWVLLKTRDRASHEIIERAKKVSEHQPLRVDTAVGMAADGMTSGEIGEVITMEFLNEIDEPQTVDVELVEGSGKPEKFGNLPTFNVVWKSERLEGDVGYVAFNAFIGGPRLITEFGKAVEEYRDSNGLIIDLRGNRGGLMGLCMGMGGYFVKEKDSLGTMKMKGAELQVACLPRGKRFDKPVVVLIDECSISAAEVMSGGFKDIGIAHVIGGRSAGLVIPSNIAKLPNGDGFQYGLSDYISASGKVLENDGVEPDEMITLNRKSLFGNQDPVLNRAKGWLLEQSENQ